MSLRLINILMFHLKNKVNEKAAIQFNRCYLFLKYVAKELDHQHYLKKYGAIHTYKPL